MASPFDFINRMDNLANFENPLERTMSKWNNLFYEQNQMKNLLGLESNLTRSYYAIIKPLEQLYWLESKYDSLFKNVNFESPHEKIMRSWGSLFNTENKMENILGLGGTLTKSYDAIIKPFEYRSELESSLGRVFDNIAGINNFLDSNRLNSRIEFNNNYTIANLSETLSAFEDYSWDIENKEELQDLDYSIEVKSEDKIDFSDDIAVLIEKSLKTEEKLNKQQLVMETYDKWAKRNPVIARVLLVILFTLLLNLAYDLLKSSVSTFCVVKSQKAYIREEPAQNSNIIKTVYQNEFIQKIGSTNYYFKVELLKEDTGEKSTGWVSKRSVGEKEIIKDDIIIDKTLSEDLKNITPIE